MTIHEDAARALLDRYMTDPGAAAVLAETRRDFVSRDFDEQYTARIGQTQRHPAYWPLHQVAAYLAVHTGLMSGAYAHVLIGIDETPGPDADREGNAAKLTRINDAFHATLDMHQNGADSDGRLRWDAAIEVEKSTGVGLLDPQHSTTPINLAHRIGPSSVPLEVGYSQPSVTFLHLHRHGGVARWAYDDDRVCLLVDVATMDRRTRRQLVAA